VQDVSDVWKTCFIIGILNIAGSDKDEILHSLREIAFVVVGGLVDFLDGFAESVVMIHVGGPKWFSARD
jgi:hypothetical protein